MASDSESPSGENSDATSFPLPVGNPLANPVQLPVENPPENQVPLPVGNAPGNPVNPAQPLQAAPGPFRPLKRKRVAELPREAPKRRKLQHAPIHVHVLFDRATLQPIMPSQSKCSPSQPYQFDLERNPFGESSKSSDED